jgi:YHS domain-containing protein
MKRVPAFARISLAIGCLFAVAVRGQEETTKTVTEPAVDAAASLVVRARLATAQEVALVPDGTQLVSPDSGKPILKNSSTPAWVYEGRLYFFCCPESRKKCMDDPRLLQNVRSPNGYDLSKLAGSGS